jgi:hypothetical protein
MAYVEKATPRAGQKVLAGRIWSVLCPPLLSSKVFMGTNPTDKSERANEEEIIFHLLVLEERRFFGRSFILRLMGDNDR